MLIRKRIILTLLLFLPLLTLACEVPQRYTPIIFDSSYVKSITIFEKRYIIYSLKNCPNDNCYKAEYNEQTKILTLHIWKAYGGNTIRRFEDIDIDDIIIEYLEKSD